MVTKSMLPGRLRLQIRDLTGKLGLCKRLENQLAQMNGVLQAQTIHRTGGLLVYFDTNKINRNLLTAEIKRMIQELKRLPEEHLFTQAQTTPVVSDSRFKAMVRDIAIMGIKSALPKPLGLLLPVAIDFIRK